MSRRTPEQKERSWKESTFPKCRCGGTLGIATQRRGGTLCALCLANEIEAVAKYDLLDAAREALDALLDYVDSMEKAGSTMGHGRRVILHLTRAIEDAESKR